MNKRLFLLPAVALALAACSQSAPPAPQPQPNPQPQPTPTAPAWPNVQGIWLDPQATAIACGSSQQWIVTANLSQAKDSAVVTGTVELRGSLSGTKVVYTLDTASIGKDGAFGGYSNSSPGATLFFDLTLANNVLSGKYYTILSTITCSDGSKSPLQVFVSLKKS